MTPRCLSCILLILGGPLLLLGGCTDVSRGTLETARLAWHRRPTLAPTAKDIAANPNYQLHVTTTNGDAILILGNLDGERELWYGKDGVFIALQHGRVVQTAGLPNNLDDSSVMSARDPFSEGLQHPLHASYERRDDWSPGYRYGVSVQAHFSTEQDVDLDILGTHHPVTLLSEYIDAPSANFHAINRYWVDQHDGFIWKSVQHVLPGVTLELTQLRPYRGKQ